ncbi:hypothetical protein CDD80_2221 [Ophiocordyceps camponoti-rufipedis]|uniref:Uncharacterized protein n=1 Tax=Ophiocordyceps camponoti-rufipedis TaxID=2004952 RepID=A0A2C5YC40_9HYPO|nr:hypothetical protein CDD80_2221 [Ophiocordyceps camponoti-rufipedis]
MAIPHANETQNLMNPHSIVISAKSVEDPSRTIVISPFVLDGTAQAGDDGAVFIRGCTRRGSVLRGRDAPEEIGVEAGELRGGLVTVCCCGGEDVGYVGFGGWGG